MEPTVIRDLPFESGFCADAGHGLPARLDFVLDIDPKTGIIVQRLDDRIREALRTYYQTGGYGSTPLGEGEFAKRQAGQIIDALDAALASAGKRIDASDFLEIGSSYGYLLHLLKQKGAKSVLGIEPGDEGIQGSRKYGIPLIQEFFPTEKLQGTFDVIFSHAVLEHIEDPLSIVEEMAKRLNSDGLIFFAVPECGKKLRVGDVSIISHQHVNYFTGRSLLRLLETVGLCDVKVVSSRQRSILYAWGVKRESSNPGLSAIEGDEPLLAAFSTAFGKNRRSMQEKVDDAERRGKHVGLYGTSIVLKGVLRFAQEPRLFDSDEAKLGKRMAGVGNTIEVPNALLTDPVDVLFVCPIDYDTEIRTFLGGMGIQATTEIVSLKELYERNSGTAYAADSTLAE